MKTVKLTEQDLIKAFQDAGYSFTSPLAQAVIAQTFKNKLVTVEVLKERIDVLESKVQMIYQKLNLPRKKVRR